MNKCTGCGCPLNWPFRTCNSCAQEFFANLGSPQPVQKSDEIQKADKEPPKPTRKPRTNRGYKLSANVLESERKMVLAQRALTYLQDAGGRLWLSTLGRYMNAYRYPEWRAAVNLLITVGAA